MSVTLKLHDVDLIPKFDADERDIVSAQIWVEADEPDLIHDYAYGAGYEVVEDFGAQESMEADDDELEEIERVIFGEYEL